jgi:hypothetical protein
MRYRVLPLMSVRLFYNLIARNTLSCVDRHICIYVNNQCLLLVHMGRITDRHFPDMPKVPTVYLTPECTAYVIYRFAATPGWEPQRVPNPLENATWDPDSGEDETARDGPPPLCLLLQREITV